MNRMIMVVAVLVALPAVAGGAGLTQHQFMAEIGYQLVSTPELADCLSRHIGAVMVGGSFPDIGYASDNSDMSEDLHQEEYIDAFIEHIRGTYPAPYDGKTRLISFMMGIGSHVADDPPYHGAFIHAVADHDFNGNYDEAHTACDAGLEFLTIIDHDRGWDLPALWVPVDDVLAAFEIMGSSYTRDQVILGHAIIGLAGYAERLVAWLLYQPVADLMPWGSVHYYDYPNGGLYNGGEVSAEYYEEIWTALIAPGTIKDKARSTGRLSPAFEPPHGWISEPVNPVYEFSRWCIERRIVEMPMIEHDDGSVTLGAPRILDTRAFDQTLGELISYLGR